MGTNEYVVTREELIAQGCTEKENRRGTRYFEILEAEIVAKECTKCGEVFTLEGFVKRNKGFSCRASHCKSCESENKTKWRKANPEKERERVSRWYESNKETVIKRSCEWSKDNPEKRLTIRKRWDDANTEKNRIKQRKWRKGSPEKANLILLRYRARKLLLPDTLTDHKRLDIFKNFNGVCALTASTDIHMDHVLPVSCGHGGTTYENMIPLRGDLNQSKNRSHIFEWFNANRERFGLSQTKFDDLITYLAEVNGMTTKEYRMYVDWCFDNPRDIEKEATG